MLVLRLKLSPYIFFTKGLKPVSSQLRREGICSSYYIDDSLYGNTDQHVLKSQTMRARHLLESLGFVVNDEKSSLIPAQSITHLGFVIDTVAMTVSLPGKKVVNMMEACQSLAVCTEYTVRRLAQVIGLIVSSFMVVNHGQLHYCSLESFKTDCLAGNQDYDRLVCLPDEVRRELLWWVENIQRENGRKISHILGITEHDLDMYSDASQLGWGAALTFKGTVLNQCSGRWSAEEAKEHINFLELKAIWLGLKSFQQQWKSGVLVHCDNTTAISYVNKYGGCHVQCLEQVTLGMVHCESVQPTLQGLIILLLILCHVTSTIRSSRA